MGGIRLQGKQLTAERVLPATGTASLGHKEDGAPGRH